MSVPPESAATSAKTIGDLAASVPGATLRGDPQAAVRDIHFDSRLIRPGDLFAALRGADFDGHRFIDSALTRGAAALLVEEPVAADVAQLVVSNSRAALAPLAAAFYDHPSHCLQTIGITGTDGKTTTSYLLESILRMAGRHTGLIGTIAVRIGPDREERLAHQTTPESSLVQRYLRAMVAAGVGTAIVEATSHGLAMHRLDGTRFVVGGVTNITHEHLEFHKTLESYRRAKAILVERVASVGGVIVLNADDVGARSMEDHAHGGRVIWYSVHNAGAEIAAREVNVNSDGSRFVLRAHGREEQVFLQLLGGFNVANALCAAGLALAAGVDLPAVRRGLEETRGVPGRMERIDLGQPFTVVVDYAHTPESLRKILGLLRSLHPGRRVIAVSGSAGERDTTKRPLQGAVSAELADISFFTSEDPRNEDPDAIIREITAGALAAGGRRGEDVFEVTDRRAAIAAAFAAAEPGDCVLLAGKGHETSMIWGYEHLPWDEAAIARELLRDGGYARTEHDR